MARVHGSCERHFTGDCAVLVRDGRVYEQRLADRPIRTPEGDVDIRPTGEDDEEKQWKVTVFIFTVNLWYPSHLNPHSSANKVDDIRLRRWWWLIH